MSWRRRAAFAYPVLVVALFALIFAGLAVFGGGFSDQCDFMDGAPDSCTDADGWSLNVIFIGGPIAAATLLVWAGWMISVAVTRRRGRHAL